LVLVESRPTNSNIFLHQPVIGFLLTFFSVATLSLDVKEPWNDISSFVRSKTVGSKALTVCVSVSHHLA